MILKLLALNLIPGFQKSSFLTAVRYSRQLNILRAQVLPMKMKGLFGLKLLILVMKKTVLLFVMMEEQLILHLILRIIKINMNGALKM